MVPNLLSASCSSASLASTSHQNSRQWFRFTCEGGGYSGASLVPPLMVGMSHLLVELVHGLQLGQVLLGLRGEGSVRSEG